MTDNDESYEQIYSNNQPQLQQQDSDYQNQLMLDQNDQIELYQNQNQKHNHNQLNHIQINDNHHSQYPKDKSNSSINNGLNQLNKSFQNQQHSSSTQQLSDTNEVINFLKTKYPHFNQQILIKMLYDSLFPSSLKTSFNAKTQSSQPFPNIKTQNIILQSDLQKDINSITKLHQTAKIFVEHGYGINIARKYALKGQNIQPNPYNNSIGKLIKNTWKAIETQMINMKKSFKELRTEKFNQIKTPLVHSKDWMQKRYFDIFSQIILYVHEISTEKPSKKSYEQIYNYVMQNCFRKSKSSEKGFYKKKNKAEDRNFDNNSSEQFKPQKPLKLSEERFQHLTNIVKKSFKSTK